MDCQTKRKRKEKLSSSIVEEDEPQETHRGLSLARPQTNVFHKKGRQNIAAAEDPFSVYIGGQSRVWNLHQSNGKPSTKFRKNQRPSLATAATGGVVAAASTSTQPSLQGHALAKRPIGCTRPAFIAAAERYALAAQQRCALKGGLACSNVQPLHGRKEAAALPTPRFFAKTAVKNSKQRDMCFFPQSLDGLEESVLSGDGGEDSLCGSAMPGPLLPEDLKRGPGETAKSKAQRALKMDEVDGQGLMTRRTEGEALATGRRGGRGEGLEIHVSRRRPRDPQGLSASTSWQIKEIE